LDAHVRCNCIRERCAQAHPFPDRLTFDETGEPVLLGNPSTADWVVHDRWCEKACEHAGILISERLGNISFVAHLREFVRALQGEPGPRFPILLGEVIFNGVHSGDWISSEKASELLKEVDLGLQSSDILSANERDFFLQMKRLCEASIATSNPITF